MNTEKFSHNIRYYVIDMIRNLGFGHLGGALSMADITAVLYNEIIKCDPKNPNWEERDFFVLSKGHGSPALYAALALKGYFPIENLYTLNKAPTMLPSHPDQKLIPGVDATTGSLGQGISIAVGIALGLRLKNTNQKVYSIVGDGELQEGQCWEAIQNAAHEKLSNLIMFVDYNQLQLDGDITQICNPFDLEQKLYSFGWKTFSINGHDFNEIRSVLEKAKNIDNQPVAVVAHTIKGKGVPQFENGSCPHHLKLDDTLRTYLDEAVEYFNTIR